ncbi:thiamine diphosphokinase [Litorisediminicola beolgyonensis]|uniref:Thiamine diphosphokinase n=1 Tax=Litorisediminicola beolgyonensis TaxID=1173614 RepID=A0ABW3ZML2_9RHOB
MSPVIVSVSEKLLLVGGGDIDNDALATGLSGGATVVAADGGAAAVLAHGRVPDAVIGDMDSLAPEIALQLPETRLHRIDEQDSTDFEKCLSRVRAPLIEAHGFLGARLDHQLAVLTTLARFPAQRCILVGDEDVAALCPPELALALDPGSRVSLWPLGPVEGRSEGLRWPIEGIGFEPHGRVGTSNVAEGAVRLVLGAPRMLVILPRAVWGVLEAGLIAAPAWPDL